MSKDTLNFSAPVPWDDDEAPGLAPALSVGEIDATFATLHAQNAELVAALTEIDTCTPPFGCESVYEWMAVRCKRVARAALAAAGQPQREMSGPTTKTDADMSRAIRAREQRTDELTALRAKNAELVAVLTEASFWLKTCGHWDVAKRSDDALAAAGHTQGS